MWDNKTDDVPPQMTNFSTVTPIRSSTERMIIEDGYSLTLKALNKNCSRRHFNFLFLSFEEIEA